MRRRVVVSPVLLVLAVAAVAIPPGARATPPVTEAAAVQAARDVATRIRRYSERHPDAPGAFVPWTAGPAEPEPPLLVHSYPSLEPSYYYVPLTSAHGSSFVTLGASDGQWQAYGSRAAGFPSVAREDAALTFGSASGLAVRPEALRVVSMPDRRLHWLWRSPDGVNELLISVSDTVHARVDARSSTPTADTAEGPLRRTPDPGYSAAYDIPFVPHHYQLTPYSCGPASVQMVMDYWGPQIHQQDIADVANTSTGGTDVTDMLRAAHFSATSSAVQNPGLHGYDERRLGYSALKCYWSQPDESDPDFPNRHADLKTLISASYPIIVVTRYDAAAFGTHARVLKGYDDSTGVYVVHDPWYDGVYQGPDVHFNQGFLVDELWPRSYRWGGFIAPWEVDIVAPDEVMRGSSFTLTAIVSYTGARPFSGDDEAQFPTVTLLPSGLHRLSPGESATKALTGNFSDPGCEYDAVTWEVVADTQAQAGVLEFLARGLIHASSASYSSYADSIGGLGGIPITIIDPDTVVVDAAGDGHLTCIQDALDLAPDGRTIEVRPGTYTGPRNRDLSFHGKNIRLRGVEGPNGTIIDCENAGRGFALTDGEDRDALIEGLTIMNGRAPGPEWTEGGGGIYLDGSSPTVRNVVLKSNSSPGSGGGMCCLGGANPRLERCTFLENEATFRGGAVASGDGSAPELVNCTLAMNAAPECGGVYCHASSPLLTDTIVYGSRDGCAIACEQNAAPVLVSCCIHGNDGGDGLPDSIHDEGTLFADPLFCDVARGVLRLQECSPCAGSGESGDNIGAFPERCACESNAVLSTSFVLHRALPSPFGTSTMLQLDVPPGTGRVRLAIYNVRGQLVRTLEDGEVSAGERRYSWFGTDDLDRPVSAGIYFARTDCEAGTRVQKLVLLR